MSWFDQTITYNRATPIGAIYDDLSVFVNLTRFFDDIKLVAAGDQDWLTDFGLADKHIGLNLDRQLLAHQLKLASSEQFAEVAKSMPRRKFLLYGPLDPPYPVNPLSYIMNSPTIAHAYEHKRYFRDEFADLINLPEYVVKRLDDLDDEAFHELQAAFGKIVIQEVESSGSKGTFIVDTLEKFHQALVNLRKISYSGTVVVSKFIEGTSCSVQVCVTKYGIFTGGLQKQLVDSKYLCNTDLPDVTKWCGGELGGNYPEILKHRTQEIATIVGSELASHGYRGIFGIDLIITPQDEVFAIEINARLTGYTHILSDMQYAKRKIPFMLLHSLELGNFKYEVDDAEALPTMSSLDETYSYLILSNQLDGSQLMKTDVKNGIYKVDDKGLTYVQNSFSVDDLPDEGHIIIFCKFRKGDEIVRGKRILKVIKRGVTMDSDEQDINQPTQKLMSTIKRHFKIEGGSSR
jgi:hypothetical protein